MKIEAFEVVDEGDATREYLLCWVAGVGGGRFDVHRRGATDEAWEAVKERLFGAPAPDLPEGVAVAADGRMYAPGDVVRPLPDAEWQRRPRTAGNWYDSPNIEANDESVYEVRRRPTPRTERVAWHEARGRRLPGGGVVSQVKETFDLPHGGYLVGATEWFPADPDGMVTVLAEDGPR